MLKLITRTLIISAVFISNQSGAHVLNCKFKQGSVVGVDSIQLTDESLLINSNLEIPLEKSRVKCSGFGRQTRMDGTALGYQVILKTCTSDAEVEGHLIDSLKEEVAEVICGQSKY